MVSAFTRPMCDIDTNEDARTYEGQGEKKVPGPRRRPSERRNPKHTAGL